MTRRSILALVILLISLLVVVPTGPVSACELNAREQCEQTMTEQSVSFHITSVAQTLGYRFIEMNTTTLPTPVDASSTQAWEASCALVQAPCLDSF